ncbi:MAG: ABC transporter permease [Bryobacterales bacterium]|nr:ABC transporter permease [Bryobacterales bacterium]
MRTLLQDLRFGLRLLKASPGFTFVAVFTLAVGIAASATVFGWVDGLLLRPFPGARHGEQLAVLEASMPVAPNGANQISYVEYLDYRRNLKSLSGLAIHHEDVFTLGDGASSQPVWGELVSGNYFDVLEVKPALGRFFTREEDADLPGAFPVAVISDRLWRSRYHADPDVAGKRLRVNRRELTIAGVAPPEFRGTMPGLSFDVWIPVTMGKELGALSESALRNRGNRSMYAVARLKPGVAIEQASAEAATLARAMEAAYPATNRAVSVAVRPVWEFHSAAPDLLLGPLRVLMAVSLVVLLIVCANVANLLLARSIARRRELSIRVALGAGGVRLSRQLLSETLLLACLGVLAALPLASWTAEMLPALVPKIGVNIAGGFQMNGRMLGFAALVCVAAALISGAAPALLWMRPEVHEGLKEGGRGGSQGAQSHRLRNLLVVFEVALATVSLIAAGLFLKSYHNARNIYPGFDKNKVALIRFYPSGTGFSTLEMQSFCLRLAQRLKGLPGVEEATYSDQAPLGSTAGPWTGVQPEGYTPAVTESMGVNRYLIAPGFFHLLRIPLLEGRDFRDSDAADAPPVVIVNETFAKRYFHGGSAIGRKVRCYGTWATVVGVAKDTKYFSVAEAPRPHFFAPYRQRVGTDQQLFFLIRTSGEFAPLLAVLRSEVTAVDPNAGAFDALPLEKWMEITMLPQTVAASLLGALGAISLLLAGVGLYSVMAYAVAMRTHEIGIRMALGAEAGRVRIQVLSRGMGLTAAGLVAGIAAAIPVTHLISSMLIGVGAADPMTLAGVALFLAMLSLLACYLPARRATRVDPIIALRCE